MFRSSFQKLYISRSQLKVQYKFDYGIEQKMYTKHKENWILLQKDLYSASRLGKFTIFEQDLLSEQVGILSQFQKTSRS